MPTYIKDPVTAEWVQAEPGPVSASEILPCVELRWVVTPELDGPQLQYRAWMIGPAGRYINASAWSEWMAVPTVFQSQKLTPPKPHDDQS